MMNRTGLVLLSLLLLNACANSGGARMGLFTATAPVVAILQDDLFLGEAIGYMDRTGTIEIKSAIDPNTRCVGSFQYTGAKTGEGLVRCNDGTEAKLSFNALGPLSGYGYGRSSRGPASFTYGLTPEEAAQYLTIPQGKRMVKRQEGPRLESL